MVQTGQRNEDSSKGVPCKMRCQALDQRQWNYCPVPVQMAISKIQNLVSRLASVTSAMADSWIATRLEIIIFLSYNYTPPTF